MLVLNCSPVTDQQAHSGTGTKRCQSVAGNRERQLRRERAPMTSCKCKTDRNHMELYAAMGARGPGNDRGLGVAFRPPGYSSPARRRSACGGPVAMVSRWENGPQRRARVECGGCSGGRAAGDGHWLEREGESAGGGASPQGRLGCIRPLQQRSQSPATKVPGR